MLTNAVVHVVEHALFIYPLDLYSLQQGIGESMQQW